MKIGLISDTHNNIEYLKGVAQKFANEYKVDKVIFLGDECEDAEVFLAYPEIEVISVPGVFCEHYKDRNIENRKIIEIEGIKILITHTKESHSNDLPDDIKPEDVIKSKEVKMVFYGHTHIPDISEIEGIIFVNPGHLKKEDKKGYSPSFGIIEFKKGKLEIEIVDFLKNEKIKSEEFIIF